MHGKTVIVTGLDGTYDRKPFRNILDLAPLADKFTKLTAVCYFCKEESASFSKRIVEDKQVELIGKLEFYRPACRRCYSLN